MVIFEIFKRQNLYIHQNAPNCTVLKNFLEGACSATCKFLNLKKIILGPPCQILGRPLI